MKDTEDILNPSISKEVSDATYTGISLFIRDTDLSLSDFLTNEVGTIFQAKSDIYVRSSFDGLRKGIRMFFLSNHLPNAQSKDKTSHPSVFTINKGDHFKLIARTTYHEKGALIFLHLVEDSWEEFYKDTSLIDALLINYATREFEVQCDIKENPKSRDWLYVENNKVEFEATENEEVPIEDNKSESLV